MLAILGVFAAANAALVLLVRRLPDRRKSWEQTELPEKWKARVSKMIGEGHRHEAVLMLKNYLRHAPDDGDMRRQLGKLLFEEGRYDEAYDAYYAALMNDPGDFIARNNMGVVLMKLGRREDALREFKDAFDASGEEFFVAANLACCHGMSGDFAYDSVPLNGDVMIPKDALMLADLEKIRAAQKNSMEKAAAATSEKTPEK